MGDKTSVVGFASTGPTCLYWLALVPGSCPSCLLLRLSASSYTIHKQENNMLVFKMSCSNYIESTYCDGYGPSLAVEYFAQKCKSVQNNFSVIEQNQ